MTSISAIVTLDTRHPVGFPMVLSDPEGPAGLLYPDHEEQGVYPFAVIPGSTVGETRYGQDGGEFEVVWCGAAVSPLGGFTKGEILEPYPTSGEVWKRIAMMAKQGTLDEDSEGW